MTKESVSLENAFWDLTPLYGEKPVPLAFEQS